MKQTDFTTGNVLRQMITFSLPIMLTNLLQPSYQFIDTLWVGNLIGANALGAVAISSTVLFSVLALILGVNSATLTILSQQKGMGNEEGLQKYLNAFVVILFLMSLVIGVAGYFLAEPLLRLLSTPDVMLQDRKSTRLNSSHVAISYAVFCLTKKTVRECKVWAGKMVIGMFNTCF